MSKNLTPEELYLAPDPIMPNSRLPVLIYRSALDPSPSLEKEFKRLFRHNGWGGTWSEGVYGYHHFHANAHEVMGVARGWVELQLGGPTRSLVELIEGDVAMLPAGTGHRRTKDGPDLLVVGAYPKGQEDFNIYLSVADCAACEERLASVARPLTDPVAGRGGPLTIIWGTAP